MSIVNEIQTLVNNIYPDATFKFTSEFKINPEGHKLDDDNLPLIVLNNEINKTEDIMESYNIMSTAAIKIDFLTKHSDKSDVHATESEINELVESMEVYARRIALALSRNDKIEFNQGESARYTLNPVIRRYSSVLSGCTLTINWKYQIISNACQT